MVAFVRLVELGKADLAYPTVLARYGIAQFCDGRRVGTRLNIQDATSPYCHRMKSVEVNRLDQYDEDEGVWKEILIEDRNAGPAETAASRLDFSGWLTTLAKRDRKVALKLGAGETTNRAANLFKISAGRVSQLRRERMASWQNFVGEPGTSAA
jgi:hypothetical protein